MVEWTSALGHLQTLATLPNTSAFAIKASDQAGAFEAAPDFAEEEMRGGSIVACCEMHGCTCTSFLTTAMFQINLPPSNPKQRLRQYLATAWKTQIHTIRIGRRENAREVPILARIAQQFFDLQAMPVRVRKARVDIFAAP